MKNQLVWKPMRPLDENQKVELIKISTPNKHEPIKRLNYFPGLMRHSLPIIRKYYDFRLLRSPGSPGWKQNKTNRARVFMLRSANVELIEFPAEAINQTKRKYWFKMSFEFYFNKSLTYLATIVYIFLGKYEILLLCSSDFFQREKFVSQSYPIAKSRDMSIFIFLNWFPTSNRRGSRYSMPICFIKKIIGLRP